MFYLVLKREINGSSEGECSAGSIREEGASFGMIPDENSGP